MLRSLHVIFVANGLDSGHNHKLNQIERGQLTSPIKLLFSINFRLAMRRCHCHHRCDAVLTLDPVRPSRLHATHSNCVSISFPLHFRREIKTQMAERRSTEQLFFFFSKEACATMTFDNVSAGKQWLHSLRARAPTATLHALFFSRSSCGFVSYFMDFAIQFCSAAFMSAKVAEK